MSGGGGGDTTTVQKADPWAGQQPYLKDLMARAFQQVKTGGPSFYPNSTVAGLDPATLQSQQTLMGAVPGVQQSAEDAQSALRFNLNDARNVESNPYLQGAINAAITPAMRRLTEAGGTIYGIGDTAQAAGQYGGTRQGIAEGIALSRFGEDALGTAASMANRGYETGLDASSRALALAPQTMQSAAIPAQFQDIVGQQRRGYEQELIDAAAQRWNFNQERPVRNLLQYQQLIQGGYGGTTSTQQPDPKANPFLGAAGGAMAGFSMFPTPIGAGVGALIGLMGSM